MKFANIWQIERDGISAGKSETVRNQFLSDVFEAVAVVNVEAPYWDVEGVFLQHVSIKVVWLFNLKLITVSLD